MPRNRPPWLLLLVRSWSRGGVLEVVKIVQIAHPKKRAPAREDAQDPARLVVLLVGPWKIAQGRGLM